MFSLSSFGLRALLRRSPRQRCGLQAPPRPRGGRPTDASSATSDLHTGCDQRPPKGCPVLAEWPVDQQQLGGACLCRHWRRYDHKIWSPQPTTRQRLHQAWLLDDDVGAHYGRQMLCRVSKTLGKAFAECHTRQRAHCKILVGKRVFAECFLSDTRQRLCRVPTLGKKKNKKSQKIKKMYFFGERLPSASSSAR